MAVNYQYGSAALAPEKVIERPKRERRTSEEKERRILEQNARRRAHKRSLRAARVKSISVTLGIMIIGSMLFSLVHMQNLLANEKKEIARLEDEITETNLINEATKSRIETAVDLNNVKEKAIYEMGMVYAGSDHIVYYELDNTDYMIRY